jgi:hypothetical protein
MKCLRSKKRMNAADMTTDWIPAWQVQMLPSNDLLDLDDSGLHNAPCAYHFHRMRHVIDL